MTASVIIALVGLVATIIGLGVRIFVSLRSRRAERAETGQRSAEQADDIRKRAQQAGTDHEATIPRLTDDELDADLARLRAAAKSGRKADKSGV